MSNAYTYEYKVVTFRESLIGDALDSDKLEKVLNKHAGDGWALKAITSADVEGHIAQRPGWWRYPDLRAPPGVNPFMPVYVLVWCVEAEAGDSGADATADPRVLLSRRRPSGAEKACGLGGRRFACRTPPASRSTGVRPLAASEVRTVQR